MADKAQYQAFFSYSHASDSDLAPAFRLALLRFAKPWYKPRAMAVFLDQSSLSANPALWPTIERALSNSEYFVLLASPASAASQWVRKELDWWLANRSADRILILLTAGDLVWDNASGDFDWLRTTSISKDLGGRFPDEPLYVDLRAIRNEPRLTLHNPKFRAAVLDVAAPLHGRAKDELDGEDIRQNRRALLLARGGLILLTVLAAAAVWQAIIANQQRAEAVSQRSEAVKQRNNAEAQTVEANKQRDRATAEERIATRERDRATEQERIAKEQRDEAVRQRDLAMARSLTAESARHAVNPIQSDVAMLLAIESMRKSPTAESYEALVTLMRDGARMVGNYPGQSGVRGLDRCFIPGTQQRHLPPSLAGDRIEVSENCRYAVAATNGRCRVIHLEGDQRSDEFACPATLQHFTPSNDGDHLAYTEKNRVTVVSAKSGTVQWQWTADRDITGLDFLRDATRLAVVMQGKGHVVFDAVTGSRISESPAEGKLSPGGEYSASLSPDGSELVLWDVRLGAWVKRIPLRDRVANLTWSADSEFLAFGTQMGGYMRVLQSESWRPLARYVYAPPAGSLERPPEVRASLSPTGDLASATGPNFTAVFKSHRDRAIITLPETAVARPVAISGDGMRVAFQTLDRNIVVSEVSTGRQLLALKCSPTARLELYLNADGSRVLSNCGSTADLHNVDTGQLIAKLPMDYASQAGFSGDGSTAAAGESVVFSATGQQRLSMSKGRVMALDHRGRLIAVGMSNRVRLSALTGHAAPRDIEPGIGLLESLALSPDGSVLAAGGRDMRVKLFSTRTGKLVRVLEHVEPDQWVFRINRLVFSPGARFLATFADDPTSSDRGRPGTFRIFELSTGGLVARVSFAELAHEVRFTPDNAYLEIAVGRRQIRWERYPLDAGEMIGNACTFTRRGLTPLEWTRFFGDEKQRDICPAVGR